jgi:hypothetical protein
LPFIFGLAFGPLEATAKLISAAKLLSEDEARRSRPIAAKCSELYSAATINGFLPVVVRAVGISTTSVSKSSFGVLIIG